MAQATASRRVALRILGEQRRRDARARDLLRGSDEVSRLSTSDRGQVTKLVLGVVAARGTLDALIDTHLRHPQRLQPRLRDAMRLSAFELCYLDTRPDVAVSQGVELVRTINSHAAGLANAVLRRVSEEDAPRVKEARERVANGSARVSEIALAGALPIWLVEQAIADRGEEESCRMAACALGTPPIWVAPNLARLTAEEAGAKLEEAKLEPEASELPGSYVLRHPAGLATSGMVNHVDVVPCDLAAQIVAAAVGARPDDRVLEVGQGRGTKSLLLENDSLAHGGTCLLTAIDDEAGRIEISNVRMRRAGLTDAVACRMLDARKLADADEGLPHAVSGTFDAAFVDAPCSGTGTLRRHPEIAWDLTSDGVGELARLQLEMLSATASRVRPGGRLAYATCSVLRQENEDVVHAFLGSDAGKGFKVIDARTYMDPAVSKAAAAWVGDEGFFQSLPYEGGCDGHFCALLQRDE